MEMPEEIMLSALTIQVERVKDLKAEDGSKCEGLADTDEGTISVESAIRGHDRLRLTLLHELAHFIENHAGATLKEAQIDSMARSLLSLIRDNPELMAWVAAPKPKRKTGEVKDETNG